MAYCGPRGIPLLHFLGGPPGWTQHDRDAALAWQMRERHRCQGCGTLREDWDRAEGGHPHAYRAERQQCPGCATLESARKLAAKRGGDEEQLPGESWVLVPQRDDDERAEDAPRPR
jgi:hypothetical protein